MVKNISINQIHTTSLSCEPLLERTANGELLCVRQCGGVREPDPKNRVFVFHSKDEGKTWSKRESIYPDDGQAVYCTELTVDGDEITAYLTVHSGRFLDWKCFMMKSFDNGYTWKNFGSPPFFPEYTFMRARLITSDGRILLPYQTYPVTKAEHDRVLKEAEDKAVWFTNTPYCESGVLESLDNGKSYQKYTANKMDLSGGWIWSEPTVAELSNGNIVMLLRRYGGFFKDGTPRPEEGFLYRCDSEDGGKTWGDIYKTDIPNPANKPRLFNLDGGRIALINTPNPSKRYPLQLWISDDDMKTWSSKTTLTDFPGSYSYTDGFYENGHIKFVIEHNRHTILYFDVTLE